MPDAVQRKLTTILAADAEGYSRMMESDEVGTLSALRASRDVFSRFIERHHGRIANTAGDGLIADFPSVVEAVQCAIGIQRELGGGPGAALKFRIGIHLGDVIVDGDDLLGEGVNLAARLQAMADPGSVLISRQVYDQVHSKLSVGFEYLGEKRPKNYSEDIAVYGITTGDAPKSRFWGRGGNSTETAAHAPRKPASDPDSDELLPATAARNRILQAGVLIGFLAFIDIMDGAITWVAYPAIAIAAITAMLVAPRIPMGSLGSLEKRGVMLVVALAMLNMATWSGTVWFVWPAAVIIALTLLRGIARRKTR